MAMHMRLLVTGGQWGAVGGGGGGVTCTCGYVDVHVHVLYTNTRRDVTT